MTVHRLSTSGMQLERISHWVRTPPLKGGTAKNWFLNGVALFATSLEPEEVLARCVQLERQAGRRRGRYWADRPLDLDLLLYDQRVIKTPKLVLPHPAILSRPFFLEPLLEVWPDAIDPTSGQPYADAPAPGGPRPARMGILARARRLRYL